MSEINIDKILDYLSKCECEIDSAREAVEELQRTIKVKEEVENFLYDLYHNEQLPQDIKGNAGRLWRKI